MEIEDTYIYKSTDVATYLIALANERRIAVNMTKVQKLLYIVYGVYLRVHEERLLNEHPQAWPYGPVFPTTRNKLLKQDFADISKSDVTAEEREKIESDERLNRIIDFVFRNFGGWNSGQLSEWSHSAGSPWHQTTNNIGFRWGDVIPDGLIQDYFTRFITIKRKDDEERS